MRGQTQFPTGFGCDPTLLSGSDLPLGRSNRRLGAEAPDVGSSAGPVLDAAAPPAARPCSARRLAEIESRQARGRPGRSVSALWPSAALGIALACSLYFLNYF